MTAGDERVGPGASSTVFEEHRALMRSVAYRILGSLHDAEDVVQETWTAWSRVDVTSVDHPRAYLVRAVMRAAVRRRVDIDRRKETYTGVWLPEPAVVPLATPPGPEERSVLREEISYALLVVLETLSPLERAVFVLDEGFGYPATEIADIIERTPAAVRQLAHRAREHVCARQPRYDATPAQRRRVTDRFVEAVEHGAIAALLEVLAPEVTYRADGGDTVRAARRPVLGRDRVGRMVAGLMASGRVADVTHEPVLVNGRPGVIVQVGPVRAVLVLEPTAPDDDTITDIYIVIDPAKLAPIEPSGTIGS